MIPSEADDESINSGIANLVRRTIKKNNFTKRDIHESVPKEKQGNHSNSKHWIDVSSHMFWLQQKEGL